MTKTDKDFYNDAEWASYKEACYYYEQEIKRLVKVKHCSRNKAIDTLDNQGYFAPRFYQYTKSIHPTNDLDFFNSF